MSEQTSGSKASEEQPKQPTPKTPKGEGTKDNPTPAYGLGTEPVAGDGPDVEAQKYELNGEDFSDLPTETRAELHRNAGRVLSTDSAGVDRVVTQHVTDWEPAPIEPDPAVVEHTERVQAALDAAREDRVNRLGLQRDAAEEAGDKVSSGSEG